MTQELMWPNQHQLMYQLRKPTTPHKWSNKLSKLQPPSGIFVIVLFSLLAPCTSIHSTTSCCRGTSPKANAVHLLGLPASPKNWRVQSFWPIVIIVMCDFTKVIPVVESQRAIVIQLASPLWNEITEVDKNFENPVSKPLIFCSLCHEDLGRNQYQYHPLNDLHGPTI